MIESAEPKSQTTVCSYTYIHTLYIYTYIYKYIHKYTHTYIYAYIHRRNAPHMQSGTWLNPTTNTPSYAYGWGGVDLDKVLYFSDSNFKMFVQDDLSISKSRVYDFCFNVQSARVPFRATIVWSDPPGDMRSELILINNLVNDCRCMCV
jgi:hypothetical protein